MGAREKNCKKFMATLHSTFLQSRTGLLSIKNMNFELDDKPRTGEPKEMEEEELHKLLDEYVTQSTQKPS